MKLEFDIDLAELEKASPKYGQVLIRIAKDQEERFKLLNVKHKKMLSAYTREFMLKLMDTIEAKEEPA